MVKALTIKQAIRSSRDKKIFVFERFRCAASQKKNRANIANSLLTNFRLACDQKKQPSDIDSATTAMQVLC